MNGLDKLIGYIAPNRGLARARARQAMKVLGSYDGAQHGRRMTSFPTQGTSANVETQRALFNLRARHRDLVRNNPWASRAVQAIVSNTVGHGITGELQQGARGLKDAWTGWAETTVCDADGLLDLYGIEALVLRAVVESGDCLIRRRTRRPGDGFKVPLQIQVQEGDYLDHSKTEDTREGGRIVQGVQFNAIGKREGYWLFPDHPGDTLGKRTGSKFVPAESVLHIYRIDRPGQVRGVPWGASAMMTLRDLDDYEDAYLLRQKLANCITGFVYDHEPNMTPSESNFPMPETLEPGLIAGLPAGKDIKFNEPPRVDGYGSYTKDVLLRVAAAYGITFQALTGDLSTVNFSSGRMGWLEMHRNIEQWRWHMLIPQMLEGVSRWWMDAVALTEGMRLTGREQIVWTPPRREMIDPTKETAAAQAAIRAGITSLPAVHREFGVHTSAVFKEIADTNALIDILGLKLDSDPRNDAAPQPVERNAEQDRDDVRAETRAMIQSISQPIPKIDVNVSFPPITVQPPAMSFEMESSPVTVNVPVSEPIVNVSAPVVHVAAPVVNQGATVVNVDMQPVVDAVTIASASAVAASDRVVESTDRVADAVLMPVKAVYDKEGNPVGTEKTDKL